MGIDVDALRTIITTWIYETPLQYIPECKFPHLKDFLGYLNKKDVCIGFFSDYPAHQKLEALSIAPDAVVCSTEEAADLYKPPPTRNELYAWLDKHAEILFEADIGRIYLMNSSK